MADDLKRVGLVFKEDGAVDFRKSLQLVNAELRENYNQFKLTQTQWDNSTKKTTKLKDELQYLTNAYDIQKSKVETLRMQLNELEGAENKDTVAIQKKKAELTKAETSLQNYKNKIEELSKQLKITGEDITKLGENISKAGEKIENAGKKISVFSTATAGAFVASAKTAIDFEDAFTGVEKTVDATDEQLEEMKGQIRELAKEMPASTTEIAAVAEAAGQLGIKTENIMSFSKAMLDLGNSTNLTSDEAASSLAKFANVTQMSQENFDRLGATIVHLGNNFATTEADIVAMAMRLAGAGKQVGMSEAEIMGFATALSSVGIEAEMGGSALSKAMVKMQNAVETGGGKLNDILKKTGMSLKDLELMSANNSKDFKALSQSIGMTSTELKQFITAGTNLEDFAKVSGMTVEQFKKAWKEDATGALSAFIKGLGDAESKGDSAIAMLTEMGLTEVRLRDSLLRAANAGNLFNDAIETGRKAWEDNTALTNEANKRYDTLKSKLTMATNKIKDMGITLGNKLMPYIERAVNWVDKLVKKFDSLNDEQVTMILKAGAVVVALGPVITILGKLTTGIGTAVKAIGGIKTALEVAKGATTSTSTAVNALAGVFKAISSPIGLACTGIALAFGSVATAVRLAEKDSKEAFSNIGGAASDFISGIDNAKSHLDEFNSTLFASAEEQQNLQTQMNEVQQGITNICKTASDERRGYTQEEITQLDEYFAKLRELNQREIEIQQAISDAITQQAVTNSQTFQGTLEEYKIQSQEWIKTADEQKTKTIELIEKQSIEEIALLNQRYGEQANMQNTAYATEYNNIMTQKQSKVDAANAEVAEVSQAYANGYLQRSSQSEGFYQILKEYDSKFEEENHRHNNEIKRRNEAADLSETQRKVALIDENNKHSNNLKEIWKKIYKDMDESQEEQLGVWLANVAQTELYGGQIDDKTKAIVDSILESYDSMPKGTRESMKNAMQPMLEEMENKEPSLFAKASGIANGILSRLKKAFDIHSPSRKTREIFKNVMLGMEKGIEEQENDLYNKTEEVAENVMDNLNGIQPNTQVGYSFSGSSISNGIDYNKLSTILTNAFLTALNKCKLTLDEDGFARIIKDELYKVV